MLVVFVEMVAKRESALVLHTTHRAHAQCRKRIVATVKKKRSRKCRSRFFSSSKSSQKKKKRSLRVVVFFPRKGKGVREKTHRHFDASGRLPADFHVEEHDWVGHDDDFDSKKKE